ncbi:MAG: hypothetical protein ACI3W5_00650 [Faecousia sp.]
MKPEDYLRKLLFAEGYHFQILEKSMPRYPDKFLRKYNTAIFVHSCFWHRHNNAYKKRWALNGSPLFP